MGGCSHSKLVSSQRYKSSVSSTKITSSSSSSMPSAPQDAAVASDDQHFDATWCIDSPMQADPAITTIEDLPPLLLAHIFSKHLSWEEVHGAASLVCQAWRQVAADTTPQQLSLEFDLVEDAAPSTETKSGQTLLQMLLSQPSRLLQRFTGQGRGGGAGGGAGAQQHQQQDDDNDDADDDPANETTQHLQQQQQRQFLQFLQNAPWARWVNTHGMQLQDLSISITNLDSNCAAEQCQLKETLLRALAESATASASSTPSSLSPSSSFASSSANPGARATPRVSDDSTTSGESSSAPETPLSGSSSCSAFSESSCSSSAASSTSSSTSTLQLKSLHLKVPLFECDVLLLANGVCAKAPALKALSLVGYSTSGSVKTRSSGLVTGHSGKSSRHRLPINHRSRSTNSALAAASPLAAAAAAAAASGSNGTPRGGDLIPVGYHTNNPAAPPTTTTWPGPSTAPTSTGRGGFITGSSLKQLMASVPQLESLTFACRQLYKLNWLAPATQLTFLSLRDCSLGGDLVRQLAALNLPKLRAVDLSGSKGLGGANAQQHLQQLTRIAGGKLEHVDISGWDLAATSIAPAAAAAAAGSTAVAAINLNSRELPHLANLASLRVLKMECCGLQGWFVQPGQLASLTHLSLSGNPLDSQGVAAACSMTQLQHLELAHVAPKELAMMPLQQPGQGPACWSGMQGMPQLTTLNLAGNFWPDNSTPDRSPVQAYRAFKHNLCSSIAAMPHLASINLTGCKAPYYKTTHLLASLPASVTEVILDRAGDGVKRADFEVLQQLPKLRVLSACGCNVRDKHACVLCGLDGLRSLILRDNAMGPEGLGELLEGCSTQLTLLDVTGNERLRDCKQAGGWAGCNSQLLLLHD